MRLAVELYGTIVGTLEGDSRTFDFTPSPDGVERFGMNSTILSATIPLTHRQRRDKATRRRNWFNELLPEGDQYDYMLSAARLRRGDTLAFLARYGRDVAGALQTWDLDDPTEPRTPSLHAVTAPEIRALLEDPLNAPLGNSPENGRTSLGGVQPKIVLAGADSGWAQVIGGYPSTHILKPQLSGALSSVIYDEEYGARLARRIGLVTYNTAIETFDGLAALVIERYDRVGDRRIHQEDLNQVLGASGNQKYQELGGVVTLRRIADALVAHTNAQDVSLFARSLVFTVAVGNLDQHAKNISLLHDADASTRLAPAYDVVPQAHRSDGRLALAVTGEYRHDAITKQHLVDELAAWGIRRPDSLVAASLDAISAAVETERPLDGAHAALRDDIQRYTRNLQEGRAVGEA